jgi:hypothetical protein
MIVLASSRRGGDAGASPTTSEHGTKRQRILAHDELFEVF